MKKLMLLAVIAVTLGAFAEFPFASKRGQYT